MKDLSTQQHLKDYLFHRVRKHICDSIWYLYSTPDVLYSPLMVAAQKARGKNEESQDQMRTMVAVTTEPVACAAELKQQITQLMAALTKVGQGSGNTITQSSPWDCGCGCSGGNSNSQPNSWNGRGGPSQLAQPHSLLLECLGGGFWCPWQ